MALIHSRLFSIQELRTTICIAILYLGCHDSSQSAVLRRGVTFHKIFFIYNWNAICEAHMLQPTGHPYNMTGRGGNKDVHGTNSKRLAEVRDFIFDLWVIDWLRDL